MSTPSPIAVVHVTCTAPRDAAPREHRLILHADGSITTPDHDAEPWGVADDVAAALGGDYRWSACAWWRHASHGGSPAFWNGPHLHPPPLNTRQHLDPSTWSIEPIADWTPQSRATTCRALALAHPASGAPETISPEQLLDACQFLSQHAHHAHWTGAIPVRPITDLLQHSSAVMTRYMHAGVPWMCIDGFITLGIQADTAGAICAALNPAHEPTQQNAPTSSHSLVDLYGGEDGFTERALLSGYEPDRLPALLRRFGLTPWMSQDLPAVRDYLDLHLPTSVDMYVHEYALAITQHLTTHREVSLSELTARVHALAQQEPDPLRWNQGLDAPVAAAPVVRT